MMVNILYILLVILAFCFLIFIHELGHYLMARRVGMRVEVFSIGFGKPIYSWEWQGERWQIGWLLFGGYVKIAGSELDGEQDPYNIKDGFFGKSPLARIKVAFMGPLMNLLFALLAFSTLFLMGGRDKKFSEFTHKIGWVDPKSELYASGIRPGDEITAYGTHEYTEAKDHLYMPMTSSGTLLVKGYKKDYIHGEKIPFEYNVDVYPHPNALDKAILTSGIISSANYVNYDKLPDGKENPLPEGSPLLNSGIQYGDSIFWVDGELIFSSQQLSKLLNDDRILVTIERDGKKLIRRIPRVQSQELKLSNHFREELSDWQFEAGLNTIKLSQLYTIPYYLNDNGEIEGVVPFIDNENAERAFPQHPFSQLLQPLQVGDKIIAVEDVLVNRSYEILKEIQRRKATIIVNRMPSHAPAEWTDADKQFDMLIDEKDLDTIVSSIGSDQPVKKAGNLVLLNTVIPKRTRDFALSTEKQAQLKALQLEQRKEIEAIEDPEKKAHALNLLMESEKQLVLGLPQVQDKKVTYNPSPIELFTNTFGEVWRTLIALFSGTLSPKWISGPVGIVQVVHDSLMTSLKDGLFLLGFLSLNLGMLNLLPIPVLDGGTIMFSFIEMITGKKMSPKIMEMLVIPFALLLIGFFIFITFNDVTRLLHLIVR